MEGAKEHPMPRTASGSHTLLGCVTISPRLLILGLITTGCSGDAPRSGSADMAASRDAGKDKPGGLNNRGTRTGDVAPVKTRGKGTSGQPTGLNGNIQGQKR
jgi:hypothetical protein